MHQCMCMHVAGFLTIQCLLVSASCDHCIRSRIRVGTQHQPPTPFSLSLDCAVNLCTNNSSLISLFSALWWIVALRLLVSLQMASHRF